MKFAIRDDDINYFFSPDELDVYFGGVWELCPITAFVIPFVMGQWRENVALLESIGPSNISADVVERILRDCKPYSIADNKPLIAYMKERITDGKLTVGMHGMHHRNLDDQVPDLRKNFAIGAEFYTNRDLTESVRDAKAFLESLFDQSIEVFSPPQNALSDAGLKAVVRNNLSVCAYFPSLRDIKGFAKKFGFNGALKLAVFRALYKKRSSFYPFPLRLDGGLFFDHVSLQPGTSVEKIKSDIDFSANKGGDFILSTHSYAFNYQMDSYPGTMKEALIEIIHYARERYNPTFTTIDKFVDGIR